MIDLEDFMAVDFLPGGRYFVGLAGDDDRLFPVADSRDTSADFAKRLRVVG